MNLTKAAALIGFSKARLLYHIKRYGEPKFELHGFHRVFNKDVVLAWKAKLIDRRTLQSKRKYE